MLVMPCGVLLCAVLQTQPGALVLSFIPSFNRNLRNCLPFPLNLSFSTARDLISLRCPIICFMPSDIYYSEI